MCSNFRKAFNPNKSSLHIAFNQIIQNILDRDGHCCTTCTHAVLPVDNPYDEATYCDISDHITESYETYKCNNYNFIGWFEE